MRPSSILTVLAAHVNVFAVQEISTSRFVLVVESVYTNATLPDAVMLGRAYDEGGASPVGLRGHMIWCSKQYAGNSSGGVGYSCGMQSSQHNAASKLSPVEDVCMWVSKPKAVRGEREGGKI